MPRKELTHRYVDVYLPRDDLKAAWEAEAKAAGLTLSQYIFETVQAARAPKKPKDSPKIREEVQKLREQEKFLKASLEKAETDLFKLQHSIFLRPSGSAEINRELTSLLRSGGTWGSEEILKYLGVNSRDADAIQIVARQLRTLQNLGFVTEDLRGWRWTE